jgi:hypothetical protein
MTTKKARARATEEADSLREGRTRSKGNNKVRATEEADSLRE